MTIITIAMLLAAVGLRTRLGRASLALWLLKASNALHRAGARAIDNLEGDLHG
ncbi:MULTISPECIES: hypothetical protein [unclassified Mesorhizobium]|uniref:hypothetical protein n=1 Tax=unclassified Mesorhizobium TaxID=325217 RepID=UPI001677695D|nr:MULTISPECIES: hypothetical protein [unclassified Mesorhizobium]